MTNTMTPSLRAVAVTVAFAGLKALNDVSITLDHGRILGLIGPNGAGKTTAVNVLSGFQKPGTGAVVLDGQKITGWRAPRRARNGIARSFQGGRLFLDFTVLENVETGFLGAGRTRRYAARRSQDLLELMGLGGIAESRAEDLPAGHQRLLGILRALALEPRYLLLDEPAAGLNEQEGAELVRSIRAIRDQQGCGVLLIEHDMSVIMPLCEQLHVLDHGQTIAVGTPQEIRSDPAVLEAYLGRDDDA